MKRSSTRQKLAGRIGGLTTAARHDPRAYTAAARQTFRDSFLSQVDPDNLLTPEERSRRADAARRAFYARLAMASATARRKRAAA